MKKDIFYLAVKNVGNDLRSLSPKEFVEELEAHKDGDIVKIFLETDKRSSEYLSVLMQRLRAIGMELTLGYYDANNKVHKTTRTNSDKKVCSFCTHWNWVDFRCYLDGGAVYPFSSVCEKFEEEKHGRK